MHATMPVRRLKDDFVGMIPLLLRRFQGSSSGHQAWKRVPLSAQPSHQAQSCDLRGQDDNYMVKSIAMSTGSQDSKHDSMFLSLSQRWESPEYQICWPLPQDTCFKLNVLGFHFYSSSVTCEPCLPIPGRVPRGGMTSSAGGMGSSLAKPSLHDSS